jgi:multiple sugar transport system permease protein
MQYVLPNTIKFSLLVGPLGYILSFLLAWMLAQIPHRSRTILAVILYTPSMTVGIAMQVMWTVIFSGDVNGYLNSILMDLNLVQQPIQFLSDPKYLMTIMIVVSLWSSMGVGFLAMLAGVLNIDPVLYEAAYVDGLPNETTNAIRSGNGGSWDFPSRSNRGPTDRK